MSLSRKIAYIWGGITAIFLLALTFIDHQEMYLSDTVNRIIQALLFVITVFLVLKESTWRKKVIFLNFLIFFFVCGIILMFQKFVGASILASEQYSHVLFWQYSMISYVFSLSVAIIYLVIDLLFQQFKIFQKYLVTLTVVSVFFFYYFAPFFGNPFFLYNTEEIKQWKSLDVVVQERGEVPTPAELASQVTLKTWRDGKSIGDLFPEENLKQIEYLYPYLEGENWMVLFSKPLHMGQIYMSVLMIGFILLFFGYQYKKDPPQGAYIDKLMFLFLIYCSMEILHFWGSLKSVEWKSYFEISSIGQYITIVLELLIALFLALRLKFITSVQGEFYETELATNPHQISRWRDWVDNLVLSHFFDSKPIIGRFFQSTTDSKQLDARLTANHEHRGIYGKRL